MMKYTIACLLFLLQVSTPAAAAAAEETMRRVFVTYKKGRYENSRLQADTTSDTLKLNFDFPSANSVVVTATEAEIEKIKADPNVERVTEDPKRYPHHIAPADRNTQIRDLADETVIDGQQTIPYGINLVQAPLAWQMGATGQGVKVCVVDSGFDLTHEDFDSSKISGFSLSFGENYTQDENGHGTHVSGTIAASNNDIGVVGVAPDAEIMMIKVFGGPNDEFVFASGLVDAAFRCRDAGAKIINMSLGGFPPNEVEESVFRNLFQIYGVLTVASSGNSGITEENYPASYPNVLSVAAVDREKELTVFSTRSEMVDLAAPGLDVLSTLPMDENCGICMRLGQSGYGAIHGTSMAAPHVAGVAALLYSYFPNANVSDVHDALVNSAQDLGEEGRDNAYGHGLVSAYFALEELYGGRIPGGPLVLPNGEACGSGEILVDMSLRTDMYGNETWWEIVRNVDLFTVLSGAGLKSRKNYRSYACLPANCYVFTIYDSRDDGICCRYGQGAYSLTVVQDDGVEFLEGGNFTSMEKLSFGGNCVSLDEEPKPEPPACVDVNLLLTMDDFPAEISLSLTDTILGKVFWADTVFEAGVLYEFNQCINPEGCHRFEILDSYGDGLSVGGFLLSYDGALVASGDSFGYSFEYYLGNGC